MIRTLTVLLLAAALVPAQSFRWPNNAKAAVALTYDDGVDVHLDHAAPDLEAVNLRGTFYVPGNSQSLAQRLDEWRALEKRGHELGNHAIFHPCLKRAPNGSVRDWLRPERELERYTVRQMVDELQAMNTTLAAIDGRSDRTYAYNCSDTTAGGESFVDALRPSFLAARTGDDTIVGDLRRLDPYLVPSWAVRDVSGGEMIAFVEKAVDAGTMAVFMFHGVGGGHNIDISREAHRKLVAWLNDHRDTVWTAPFRDVMQHVVAEKKRLGWVAAPREPSLSGGILDAGVALVKAAIEADELRGAVLLVARHGDVVLHEALGWRDKDRRLPMEKDTLFHMASNTKPVVAAAVLMLAEEGKLSLDDPVRTHLPSFDNHRAGRIKIRHLLSHTSGFRIRPIFLRPLLDNTSLQAEVARFGKIGAERIPGSSYQYSNPGYNTLGAIVEIVSGLPLDQFLKQRIYDPLGMKDSSNHESQSPAERMAIVYKKRQGAWRVFAKPGDPPRYPFVRASGGMISTAADYFRFCQAFLNGGSNNSARILREESVRTATSAQTRRVYTPDELWKRDSFYGYGWSVRRDGIYSHGGSEGTYAWIDPRTKVIGLFFTQSPNNALRRQFQKLVEAAVHD